MHALVSPARATPPQNDIYLYSEERVPSTEQERDLRALQAHSRACLPPHCAHPIDSETQEVKLRGRGLQAAEHRRLFDPDRYSGRKEYTEKADEAMGTRTASPMKYYLKQLCAVVEFRCDSQQKVARRDSSAPFLITTGPNVFFLPLLKSKMSCETFCSTVATLAKKYRNKEASEYLQLLLYLDNQNVGRSNLGQTAFIHSHHLHAHVRAHTHTHIHTHTYT